MRKTQYLDLAERVSADIESGKLAPGARLPTHRLFAEQHSIAVATATRTYRELERRGLIVGERGRGVFVRDPGQPLMLGIEQTAPDGLIDLVCNIPREDSDPEILREGLKSLAASGDLDALMRYQPHVGRLHERRVIANHLGKTLGEIDPERILITSGIQHGLTITLLGLFSSRGPIGTDQVTYPGFKSIAALQGCDLVPIADSEGSMDMDALDLACRERNLRALYLMPTVHNPMGTIMSEARRHQLVQVADKHNLLIIEDSAYAYLEPNPPKSLVELAPQRTIHLGGFSKSFATGLRVGYIVCSQEHVETLGHVIRATTWNTPALMSALVTSWISDGTVARVEENRRRDGARRQKICQSFLKDFEVVAHRNSSVAWIPLAPGLRTEPIITRLHGKGIAVSAGEPFAVTDAVPQVLRLAFGGFSESRLNYIFEIVRSEMENAQ